MYSITLRTNCVCRSSRHGIEKTACARSRSRQLPIVFAWVNRLQWFTRPLVRELELAEGVARLIKVFVVGVDKRACSGCQLSYQNHESTVLATCSFHPKH